MKGLTSRKSDPQLSTFHDELDGLFEQFFGDLGVPGFTRARSRDDFVPAIETFLDGDALVVRADLPGIDPKAVDLEVDGERLTIRGERTSSHEDAERQYREVYYGRFERSVRLPAGVDPDSVEASYHDGVLEVRMAAPKGAGSKKVPIQVH